jgi:hypothetical protein
MRSPASHMQMPKRLVEKARLIAATPVIACVVGGALALAAGCAGELPARNPAAPPAPDGPSCEVAYEAWLVENALVGDDAGSAPPPVESYGNVLDYGKYFAHCRVPEAAEIRICAAIENGSARGVTVVTQPRNASVEACIDQAVRRLHFPVYARMELARTFFGAAGAPIWGVPRRDVKAEARVSEFLSVASSKDGRAAALCSQTLVVMPKLWAALDSADPSLAGRGVEMLLSAEKTGSQELSLRVLDGVADIEAIMASAAFAELARRLAVGRVRAADAAEREIVFKQQMVAFTPDAPVTVVEAGELKLAVLLADGRVYWMELLSAPPGSDPAAPPTRSDGAD